MMQIMKIEIDHSTTEYRFSLELYVFQENDSFIAYCPALDLSTSADSFNEAVSNFYESLQLYIECCLDNGTLQEDLAAHGWKLKKNTLVPPSFSSLLRKPEMRKLMDSHLNFERIVTPARIPAIA